MRWPQYIAALFIAIVLFGSCSSNRAFLWENAPWTEIDTVNNVTAQLSLSEKQINTNIPQTWIKLRFHIVNSPDSSVNFKIGQGEVFVNDLLNAANSRLRTNDKMFLPEGNSTPVLSTGLQLELDSLGIVYYFENPNYFIKSGARSNRYKKSNIEKYSEGSDSILHIVLMPFDPIELKTQRQKIETTGIALDNTIKIAGYYESGGPGWQHAGILNHEIGHVLGLRHSWIGNDGCSDTPVHDNCWAQTESPPCDHLSSNNLMDYNAHQAAITPCQIAKMYTEISLSGSVASRVSYKNGNKQESSDKKANNLYGLNYWLMPMNINETLTVRTGAILHIYNDVIFEENGLIFLEKGAEIVWDAGRVSSNRMKAHPHIRMHKKSILKKKKWEPSLLGPLSF